MGVLSQIAMSPGLTLVPCLASIGLPLFAPPLPPPVYLWDTVKDTASKQRHDVQV